VATDTGIVTLYDLKNGGKPLKFHRIDAKEILASKSKRWSTSLIADGKKDAIGDAKGEDTGDDTGEAMRLKSMTYKALQAMAKKAGIPGYDKMPKADIVKALIAGPPWDIMPD